MDPRSASQGSTPPIAGAATPGALAAAPGGAARWSRPPRLAQRLGPVAVHLLPVLLLAGVVAALVAYLLVDTWLASHLTLVRWALGAATGLLLVATVATFELARRAAARDRDEACRLGAILDAAQELVQSIDAGGRLRYVNRAWERKLGWSRREARALRFAELVSAESWPRCEQALRTVGERGGTREVELVLRSRTGERLEVVGTVSAGAERGERVARAFLRDVTNERATQAALAAREASHRHVVEGSLALICRHDLSGHLLLVNPAAAQALGYRSAELEGRQLADLVAPEHHVALDRYLACWKGRQSMEGDLHVRTRAGATRVWHFRNRLIREPPAPPTVIGVAFDVTAQRRAEAALNELAELARLDPLTRLANRRSFEEQLGRALAVASRQWDRGEESAGELTVGLIDLDGFKAVNDRHGHAAGDHLLTAVADALSQNVRRGDLVARLGGDEFALLLPESGQPEAIEALAGKLLAAVEVAAERAAPGCRVTASLGLARLARPGQTAVELMRAADEALYAAKKAGRNRVHVARDWRRKATERVPRVPSRRAARRVSH